MGLGHFKISIEILPTCFPTVHLLKCVELRVGSLSLEANKSLSESFISLHSSFISKEQFTTSSAGKLLIFTRQSVDIGHYLGLCSMTIVFNVQC